MRLVEPILKAYQEQSHLLVDKGMSLCPADQRIQVLYMRLPHCALVPPKLPQSWPGRQGLCARQRVCLCLHRRARELGGSWFTPLAAAVRIACPGARICQSALTPHSFRLSVSQNWINDFLSDVDVEPPKLPARQLKLDRHGMVAAPLLAL